MPGDYKRFVETVGPGVFGEIVVASPNGAIGAVPGLFDIQPEWESPSDREAATRSAPVPVVWGRAPDGWSIGWLPGDYETDRRPALTFKPRRGGEGRGCSMTGYLATYLHDPSNWEVALWRVGLPD